MYCIIKKPVMLISLHTLLTTLCVVIFMMYYSDGCWLTNVSYATYENCIGLNGTDFILSTLDNVTPIGCAQTCEEMFRCRVFFHNKNTQSCSLHYRDFEYIATTPESATQCYIPDDIDESWAVNVIRHSSYIGNNVPKAIRNKPNGYSWASVTELNEFIEFQIDTKMFVEEMIIYEKGNAGGVHNISVIDPDGDWQTVWVTEGLVKIPGARNMTAELMMTDFKTDTLRIDKGYRNKREYIDAVKVFGKHNRRTPLR